MCTCLLQQNQVLTTSLSISTASHSLASPHSRHRWANRCCKPTRSGKLRPRGDHSTQPSDQNTMLKIASLLLAIASLVVTMSGAKAAPMNKCVVNGTVTYQQDPCPSTQTRKDPTLEELNSAERNRRAAAASSAAATPKPTARAPASVSGKFSCDGRTYCSQMHSCEEAKYFLANCPGAKMDGDGNGIPCEKQWCSR